MNTFKNTLEKIIAYINEARKLVPHITDDMLYNNGSIYYMNGNDGTDFDWFENNCLCEFMIFGKNQKGFIKVYVCKNDTLFGYMYENFGHSPTHDLDTVKLDDGASEELCLAMFRIADLNDLWDMPLEAFDFNIVINDDDMDYMHDYYYRTYEEWD